MINQNFEIIKEYLKEVGLKTFYGIAEDRALQLLYTYCIKNQTIYLFHFLCKPNKQLHLYDEHFTINGMNIRYFYKQEVSDVSNFKQICIIYSFDENQIVSNNRTIIRPTEKIFYKQVGMVTLKEFIDWIIKYAG